MRERLDAAMRRIAFWIVPSAMAFLAIGDVVAGVIYQNGKFDRAVAVWVWGILAGSAVGLLGDDARPPVFASALYALRDTKTPFRVRARPRGAHHRARLSVCAALAGGARAADHSGAQPG
jgi:putative peptidoglycan lipid II flippase